MGDDFPVFVSIKPKDIVVMLRHEGVREAVRGERVVVDIVDWSRKIFLGHLEGEDPPITYDLPIAHVRAIVGREKTKKK